MKKITIFSMLLFIIAIVSQKGNLINAQPHLSVDWAKKIGSPTNVGSLCSTRDIKVDSLGNVYVVGTFSYTVDFSTGGSAPALLTARNNSYDTYVNDVFVAKYNSAGALIWVKQIGSEGEDQGTRIALDESGNVYVSGMLGQINTPIYFDTGATAPNMSISVFRYDDAFVAKYDNNGNFIWAKNFGGNGYDGSWALSVNKAGTKVYAGSMVSANTVADTAGILMVKFDANNGDELWRKHIIGDGLLNATGIVLDTAENLYISGTLDYASSVDFDPSSNVVNWTSAGASSNPFLAKYDSAGNYIWVQGGLQVTGMWGASQYLAIDKSNSVYIVGHYNGTALTLDSAGLITLAPSLANDGYIAKYNSDGQCLWAHSYGTFGNEGADGVGIDQAGNVILIGSFLGTVDFDPGPNVQNLTAVGSFDACWAKYDSLGNYLQAGRIGGSSFDWGRKLAVDPKGAVYLTGNFRSDTLSIDFGNDSLIKTIGLEQSYIVKLFCGDTTTTNIVVTECAESYSLNGEMFTASGIYTRHFPSLMGCDSVVVLDLTLNPIPEPIITVDVDTLGTTQLYSSYQWLKNGQEMQGATNSKHTVTENADYQVVVTTENGCTDTSDIYIVTNHGTSLDEINRLRQQVAVYPNPSSGQLFIKAPVALSWELLSIDGRSVQKSKGNQNQANLKNLSEGVYLLKIFDKNNRFIKTERIIYKK